MWGDVALLAALRAPSLCLATMAQVRHLGRPTPWDPADPHGMALQATGDPTLPGRTTLTLPGHTTLTKPQGPQVWNARQTL